MENKNDKLVANIYETTNYEQFKKIKGNRNIAERNKRRILKSMNEKYIKIPICINKNFEVIDGQHRLECAKILGKPILYYVLENAGIKEIQKFQQSKGWDKRDYVNYYCEMGNINYIKLRNFMNKYEFIPYDCAVALTQNRIDRLTIKDGDYIFVGEDVVNDLMQKFFDFSEFIDKKIVFSRSFASVLITLLKSKLYDHEKMKNKIPYLATFIRHTVTTSIIRDYFETAYNYRSREKVSFKYIGLKNGK